MRDPWSNSNPLMIYFSAEDRCCAMGPMAIFAVVWRLIKAVVARILGEVPLLECHTVESRMVLLDSGVEDCNSHVTTGIRSCEGTYFGESPYFVPGTIDYGSAVRPKCDRLDQAGSDGGYDGSRRLAVPDEGVLGIEVVGAEFAVARQGV